MEIIPAVDLYEGQVVRLERGDYQKRKVYSSHPEEVAQQWVGAGAQWLHVVDLEGARSGEIKNWTALERILQTKTIHVQFGGGIRNRDDVERLFRKGVDRVILGSKVLDPNFLRETTESHGDQIALSLDLRGEEIQVEGWLKSTGKSVDDLFREISRFRVNCLIVTDIERDGTLMGINLEKIRYFLKKAPFPVILSGGVASLDDIRLLRSLRVHRLKGVIIGKALYEGRVDLATALRIAQAKES